MLEQYLEGRVVKSWESSPEERAKVEESRTIQFKISSDAKDRHGTRLNMKGWKLDNYNSNPIVGYQHNVYGDNMCSGPNPDDVIGKGRAFLQEIEGKTWLMGEVTFDAADINPLAEKIFRKILAGSLNATSVGFLEVGKGQKKKELIDGREVETYFYEGQELLEWSVVNIPSNPEATKKSLVNHTRAGIGFLTRMGISVTEIRKIANDILDAIELKEKPTEDPQGPKPDADRFSKRVLNRKNKV